MPCPGGPGAAPRGVGGLRKNSEGNLAENGGNDSNQSENQHYNNCYNFLMSKDFAESFLRVLQKKIRSCLDKNRDTDDHETEGSKEINQTCGVNHPEGVDAACNTADKGKIAADTKMSGEGSIGTNFPKIERTHNRVC